METIPREHEVCKYKLDYDEPLEAIGIRNTPGKIGIYIRAEGRPRFFDYILSHRYTIPKCYEYKFPEVYCANIAS